MNQVFYRICKHCGGIISGDFPCPLIAISRLCGLSLYKTRKELKRLKKQGLVVYDCCDKFIADKHIVINGYTITEKGKETEEYKKALQEKVEIFNEFFGHLIKTEDEEF